MRRQKFSHCECYPTKAPTRGGGPEKEGSSEGVSTIVIARNKIVAGENLSFEVENKHTDERE